MDIRNRNQLSPTLRHSRVPRIAVGALFVLLAGCSPDKPADQSAGIEPDQTESKQAATSGKLGGPEKDIRPAVKQVVAAAIAGNYNQYCNDVSGDAPVARPEQSIVISEDGMLRSGAGDVDFINATTTAFVLTVDRPEQMLSAGIDVQAQAGTERAFVIGVHRLAETVGATVTNETQQPARALGCSGPIPPAFTMDLWSPVMQQIGFDTVTAHCTAIPMTDKGSLKLGVHTGQLTIGDQVFSAEQNRSNEGIQVSDDGVVYSFTAADRTGYDLFVQPDGSFSMLTIHRNDEHINCI